MAAGGAGDYDHLFKILLIGDAGVGKSSIMLRFTDDSFDQHINSTIGVDFKVKMLKTRGTRVKMTIWDTAGQERFRTLTSSYYRGAQGIILTYDVTRADSFASLDQWLQEMEVYCPGGGREVVKLLVGNKIDKDRVVEREVAEEWARSKGMIFLETSAKTNVGIKQAFQEVVEKILENPLLLTNTAPGKPKGVGLSSANDDKPQGGCC
mmetsp:Transcript_36910/g.85269  ORF Transcript_36910/g.85269 Transcript_36910/m.85269 type:complete len:208 (-) Transcript_36910:49-672(-)|eukprot:CAMPEP_0119542134 /NCGR_PEP_ID=MMETSP1344-20130328/53395_1 /TAXON_ID=236787 /ORGANISM="Florenciella parvula, Strain CCMP2471" /LENGTH=207 /DNA_ID=CAMNT_0007586283 /DNA_START=29 /DNA_END=652 /DNA_ORIENTATION=+